MLQNDEPLLHRLYKERYFPRNNFFNAKLGQKTFLLGERYGRQKRFCPKCVGGRLKMANP